MDQQKAPIIINIIAPGPCLTIQAAAVATGYSEKAIRRKIQDGKWLEGKHWHKAPDGHVLIDLEGYVKWAKHGT